MARLYKPIKPKDRLYQDIMEQIQGMILSGKLKHGDRLPAERQLAEDFGVSRTAVREAIKSLAEKGMVEIFVGRGTFVTVPSTDHLVQSMTLMLRVERGSVDELQLARELLEIPIARLAAENRREEHLVRLDELLREMETHRSSTARFLAADTEFHMELGRATGNRVLQVLSQTIVAMLREERAFVVSFRDEYPVAVASHREILERVRGGDGPGAAEAMRNHLARVNEVLQTLRPGNVGS